MQSAERSVANKRGKFNTVQVYLPARVLHLSGVSLLVAIVGCFLPSEHGSVSLSFLCLSCSSVVSTVFIDGSGDGTLFTSTP